ncbi:hypothetical protein HDK90DRAFT_57615 [Phyllosticta capitalensis]|uniref:FAD/NAD(P)-binding domain-containing protein n=1 Tax=Phyllosticta capitalensis TaxID=121624 RepID=A0ABR1YEZ3_9PEZI
MEATSLIQRFFSHPIFFLFEVVQFLWDKLLSPSPPPPSAKLRGPKIAIIGAGVTGVSAAAYCVGHGIDCTIFEAGDRNSLGGIWSKVNDKSGLQIHGFMYTFHPSVKWSQGYPDRPQIVRQVTELWERYGLGKRTRFDTHVSQVYKDESGRWIINDPSLGRFDGIIAAVGTCGEPKAPYKPGQESFDGKIHHSSKLDGKSAKGKRVIVIGGGASAVEALEHAVAEEAKETIVLARSEKWILPRNPLVHLLLIMNVFGRETIFSWVPEWLLRTFFYRELKEISPPPGSLGLFTETPMSSDNVLAHVRSGKAKWLRGDIVRFEENGIKFNHRAYGVPKDGPGHERFIDGDVVIMATGFKRPSLSFLPSDCFDAPYTPPNWYLQAFPPGHMDVCGLNCTYVNAIASAGCYHIGIYTRLLLMYLMDPLSRPQERTMKVWVDLMHWFKAGAPGGAFDFFTYSEMMCWFAFTMLANPFRWKWALFIFGGVGMSFPMAVVQLETWMCRFLGVKAGKTHEEEKINGYA